MEKFERLRPVGGLERYSTARHHLKFYINAAVSATYTLPESFTLPVKDYVYRACQVLIGQHPILSAITVDEDTQQPYYVRLPEINLDDAVSFQERQNEHPSSDEADLELEALLQVQHNTPFSPPSPFWRLRVLIDPSSPRHLTAAFVFHHAIGDGASAKAFHKTFLEALGSEQLSSGQETKRMVTSPQTPLLPNAEALHPMPLSIPYIAMTLFKAKIWSWRDSGLWTGSDVCAPMETQIRHIVLPKAQSGILKKRCRENSTTITATLQTVMARCLFTHLPAEVTRVQCSNALSTRRWLPDNITDDVMGVWIQDYNDGYSRSDFPTDSSSLFPWSEARRSRKTIEDVLSLKGKNASPSLLKYINDYQQELFLSQLGHPRGATFEMSNVGVLAVDGANDISRPQIERMVFSQSANVIGPAIEVSAVTGGDGCLSLVFSWQKGVVDDGLISSVIQSTREMLFGLGV